mmetsp:Transcript_25924/g.29852  ORF Transcript_25924/g.29852 Transcript_25924/m.29852 type:complete len:101 (-) Transcript_25924:334-636(-)
MEGPSFFTLFMPPSVKQPAKTTKPLEDSFEASIFPKPESHPVIHTASSNLLFFPTSTLALVPPKLKRKKGWRTTNAVVFKSMKVPNNGETTRSKKDHIKP